MAASNKKAAGVAAPTANDSQHYACDCARSCGARQVPGIGTIETFIGSGLRHGRSALSLVLNHGPADARIARELRRGREAFDRAIWLADYCEADQ